jgi:hypothetical protein
MLLHASKGVNFDDCRLGASRPMEVREIDAVMEFVIGLDAMNFVCFGY